MTQQQAPLRQYKLGMVAQIGYRRYCNQYRDNDYAQDPYERAERKKQSSVLERKFALEDDGLFYVSIDQK